MTDSPLDEGDRPVIRDKRRIDPETGEPRAAADPGPDSAIEDELAGILEADLQRQVEERTADLQRLQAEFANYRRRVDRDRQAVAEQALGSVLLGLLPVLDDVDRARAHGEVEGGFKLVADGLDTTLAKLGLQRFGEAGEPFDPNVHEALTHTLSGDVDEPVCAEIYQPGYRVGERVLRPARVAVAEPAEPASTTVE
ncbi:MAG: molecular chaperone GrpE [Frankiaceae bacterium]|nr:molecular chaperone GrpE [Frankiaceae bacterium]